ncbi:MAG: hypothetical protein ACOCXG_04630 [Nanoarchaeota archaeon]
MVDVLTWGAFGSVKVIFVALLMYVIIYAILTKFKFFGDDSPGVNTLVALLTAVIVSFSGVVTYAVTYATNWFLIIFFIVFLMLLVMLFMGVKLDDVAKFATDKKVMIMVVFLVLFAVIIIKSFFAVNNAFDLSDPPNSSYEVDASFNTGTDDVIDEETQKGILALFNIDSDLFAAFLFLLVIGGFAFFLK